MIEFRDLSLPLKVGIVTSWIVGVLYIVLFLIGFILGIIGG
jgi:hypothetical protein